MHRRAHERATGISFTLMRFQRSSIDAYRSSDAGPTVWRAEEDVENFRAALEWGQEKHVEENLRLAANYCIATGAPGLMSEGVEAAKNAVERARLLPPATR